MNGDPPESRRDRLRRELTGEILRIARRQIVEAGARAVSWRGIAREVGMNPASLYTYFASIDDLYTALIVEGFDSLGRAIEVADAEAERGVRDPTDRLVCCAIAYRGWALDHPAEFNLIFTDQIPGYAAPPGGPTFDAEMAVLRPLIRSVGRLVGRDADPARPDAADPAHLDASIALWGTLHGLVILDTNHHLPLPDQEARFERIMRTHAERIRIEFQ